MIKAILNNPNLIKRVHRNLNCGFAPTPINNDRYFIINMDNLGIEIQRLREVQFGNEAHINHLHLEINFNNEEFELAVLKYLCSIIEIRYHNFSNANIDIHC